MRSWKFRQHYPTGTLSVDVHCTKCNKETPHRVFGNRLSNVCIPCEEKAEVAHQAKLAHPEAPIPVQEALFA
jgi:hypothetical protein